MFKEEQTVCPYCGVGCGINISILNSIPKKVSGVRNHPVSRGHLCAKGFAALDILASKERLLYPLKKNKDGNFEKISWSDCTAQIVSQIKDLIRNYGPDSIGFSGGCLCTNEENYLIQKLARRIGTNNIDSCARLCHQPSLHALKRMVGFGAASTPMSSMKDSKLLLFIGSSLADSHPILTQYVMEAKNKGAKVIDVDPRVRSFSKFADLHLKIEPRTDIALLNGMANIIINENLHDKKFIQDRTTGFVKFKEAVQSYTPERVETITNLPSELIKQAARLYATSGCSLILAGIGITEQAQGTDTVSAVVNLALLTGNYGKMGSGVCPLRGQANVQGAGDMGASSEFLPGGIPLDQSSANALGDLWGFAVSHQKGCSMMEMIAKSLTGEIKALYFMGFNPVHSLPNRTRTEKALSSLELLVVQDIFMSSTAMYASYVLPAATWLEREGSMTNMDRMVQWRNKLLEPFEYARPDWEILVTLAKSLGYEEFDYRSPEDILDEISKVIPNYAGVSRKLLQSNQEVRYPMIHGKSTHVLFSEKFNMPEGRASFFPVEYKPVEFTSEDFPLVFTTGRVITRYNTDTMTSKSQRLLMPGVDMNYVEVNPGDATKIGLVDGDYVRVASRFGEAILTTKVTTSVKQGMLFAPMHGGKVNYITGGCLDETSLTPCYKWTAVRLSKI